MPKQLPAAYAPCVADPFSRGPAKVTDVDGVVHDITWGTFVILDVPGPSGKMRAGWGITGSLLARDGNKILIRFRDKKEVWVPLVSKFQIDGDDRDDVMAEINGAVA